MVSSSCSVACSSGGDSGGGNPGSRLAQRRCSPVATQAASVRQQHPLPQQQPAPSIRLRAALRHLYRIPKLWSCLSVALAVALLILLVSSMVNAFNIRAFRDASACQGENNLSVCVGKFTGYVNGVRTSPQNMAQPRSLTPQPMV